MVITLDSAQRFRSRIAQVIALSGVIAVAACQDAPTAPDVIASGPALRMSTSADAAAIADWVVDATSWVTPSMVDPTNRGKLEGSINGLSGHLKANNTKQIKGDIAIIRSLISGGSEAEAVELGPIEVALCTIEQTLGIQ